MMTPERWQQLKGLLAPALDIKSSERVAYLDRVSAGDPVLRADLERLLAAEEEAGTTFLDIPPNDLADDAPEDKKTLIGLRIGAYQVVEKIGSGGMGEVYRAFRADDQYRQQVAIKLVRARDDSRLVVQRFKNERQILASLDHPNIARLLDGGRTEEGEPYFVMELIEGLPLNSYCDEHKLPISERLRLFIQVCSAVQYAHQRLIIHRDIKQSNILVTSEGVPKLLDFGIAKIMDEGAETTPYEPTLTLFRVLTPAYASPEQIRGQPLTITSDVYSLGVVLYELLAGRSPYRVASRTPTELARAACEDEPERLSSAIRRTRCDGQETVTSAEDVAKFRQSSPERLGKQCSGDLDNIVQMALRKEPQRRYASVEQFAQDIGRHLGDLPVLARRDTVRYRTSKFLTRHKAGVAAAAAVFLTLLLGMAVTVRQARIARQQAEVARMQRVRAERRFNDVRKLANSLVFDIHDSIQDLPGATAARKVLVDRAVQYLDSLAQEAAGDPGLQRELASAYERLGDVQGKPLASHLGDDAAALQSYNKSLVLREELARSNQANARDAISLARIHRLIADIQVDAAEISRAFEHAQKAVAIATVIPGSETRENPAAAAELARDYIALGCVKSGGGFNSAGLSDPLGAVSDFKKALGIAAPLFRDDPNNVALALENEVLYERIGGMQGMHGLRAEGLRNMNVSLSIFRSLEAKSGNGSHQGGIAALVSLIGKVLVMDGRFPPGLANQHQELTVFKSMAERDPRDLQARENLSGADYDVGDTLIKMGKLRDGLALVRRAITIDRELMGIDPRNSILRSNLAQHRVAEAEALSKVGDENRALQGYEEARRFYQSLAELDDRNLDARLNVSATDAKIAATYLRLQRVDGAREAYLRALQVSEPRAGQNPPNLQAQYTVADAYSGLGDLAVYVADRTKDPTKQLSQRTEAKSWYEKSLRVWRAIPNRSVISPSQFDVGDPSQVKNHLAACETKLAKGKTARESRLRGAPKAAQ